MSKNLAQIFIANPVTTIGDTDILYVDQAGTTDAGISGASLKSQFVQTASTQPVNKGGTGQTSYTDGQLLIGNSSGNTLTKASLTAGTNITITPGAGSITISAAGGTSPWTAGTGANSAKGGDGSTTATGANSLCYGLNGSDAGGFASFVLGNNVSSSSGSYNICVGALGSVTGTCSGSFGQHVNVGANFAWGFGNNVTNNQQGSWVIADSSGGGATSSASNTFYTYFTNGFKMYSIVVGVNTLCISSDTNANFITNSGQADLSKVILTPLAGDTITLATTNYTTILNPAGTIATLTVNMPATPVDGQKQRVTSTQVVTALTVSGNGNTIIGQPTSMAVGSTFTMIYDDSSTTWFPG